MWVLLVPMGDQALVPLAQALFKITLFAMQEVAIQGRTRADDIPEFNLKVGNLVE